MEEYKPDIVWSNLFMMTFLHLAAFYGIKCSITDCQIQTNIFACILIYFTGIGIMAGVHRYWCHRSYKANLPLRIILAILQTMSLQLSIYNWCRDHRTHHKYVDTDADPHNSSRGFFYSHIGWYLVKRHPDYEKMVKTVDMSDLEKDPVVGFQRRFYFPLALLFWGVIPTLIPYYFWNESLSSSLFICVFYRHMHTFHITMLVNSAAHIWGTRPYDKKINPVECVIKDLIGGEGFHNYHHAFPWDYSASEHGPSDVVNPMTSVIDFFAKIGWAYDLKKVSRTTIDNKMLKSGDNTVAKPLNLFEYIFGFLIFMSNFLLLIFIKLGYKLYISI